MPFLTHLTPNNEVINYCLFSSLRKAFFEKKKDSADREHFLMVAVSDIFCPSWPLFTLGLSARCGIDVGSERR